MPGHEKTGYHLDAVHRHPHDACSRYRPYPAVECGVATPRAAAGRCEHLRLRVVFVLPYGNAVAERHLLLSHRQWHCFCCCLCVGL